MDNSVANKYYLKIKNDVLSYSLMVKDLIIVIDNKIFTNKKEVEGLYKKIISIFYEDFINDSATANDKVNEYFAIEDENPLVDNRILAAIIVYYESIERAGYIKENKVLLVTTALIISLGYEISELASPFENRLREINQHIITRLSEIDKLSYIDVNYTMNNLDTITDIAKGNRETMCKFFKSFNSSTSYNVFLDVTSENKYYLVEYKYAIPNLSKFKSKDINKYRGEDTEKSLFYVSCYLLSATILKEIVCNSNDKLFLLNLEAYLFKSNSLSDTLRKIFEKNIRNRLYLLVEKKLYDNNATMIEKLKNEGFILMVNCDDEEALDLVNNKKQENIMLKANSTLDKNLLEDGNNIVIRERKGSKVMKNNF